ncbi:MAG: 50S ribosomal protein L11 methyltransferase [Bdellovibrionota bacterium]
MQNTHYFNVVVTGLSPEQAEIASALFFENGAEGVSENLPFFQSNESADAVLLDQDEVTLHVYFSNEPPAQLKTEVSEQFPEARLEVFKEPHKDWLAEWKKFYSPFELAHGVWVVPAWLEKPAEAVHEIRINPGMAFGTGTHETTRLAAQMMAKNFLTSDTIGADHDLSLLDVGTGTGILCFLAEKFGFSKVVGVEIDPEARRSARENIPLNKNMNQKNGSAIEILEAQLHEIVAGQADAPKQYDWVVANIIDGILAEIQNDLKAAVASKGYLLLTGILDERDELFLSRFSFDGFTLVKREVLGEWVGYLLQKKD